MTLPTSRLAYADCFEAMDRALADDRGIRLKMDDQNQASFLRMRMHQARSLDRKENLLIYEEGHMLCGRSIYDTLVLRVRTIREQAYLYIEQIKLNYAIEDLSTTPDEEFDPPQQIVATPQPQVEGMPRLQIEFKRRV